MSKFNGTVINTGSKNMGQQLFERINRCEMIPAQELIYWIKIFGLDKLDAMVMKAKEEYERQNKHK